MRTSVSGVTGLTDDLHHLVGSHLSRANRASLASTSRSLRAAHQPRLRAERDAAVRIGRLWKLGRFDSKLDRMLDRIEQFRTEPLQVGHEFDKEYSMKIRRPFVLMAPQKLVVSLRVRRDTPAEPSKFFVQMTCITGMWQLPQYDHRDVMLKMRGTVKDQQITVTQLLVPRTELFTNHPAEEMLARLLRLIRRRRDWAGRRPPSSHETRAVEDPGSQGSTRLRRLLQTP